MSAGTPANVLPPTETSTELALADEQEFNKAATSALTNVRKAAENWRTGLAGLLTLVTTVLFIKGKSAVDEFTPGWRIAIGVLLLGALSLAVVALWYSLRAAYGSPKLVEVDDVLKAGGLTGWTLGQAQSSIDDLDTARILAVISAALVGAVMALSWWTPKSPPAFVSIKKGDTVICGKLLRLDGGQVRVEVDGEHKPQFSVDKIDSLRVVSSCS